MSDARNGKYYIVMFSVKGLMFLSYEKASLKKKFYDIYLKIKGNNYEQIFIFVYYSKQIYL